MNPCQLCTKLTTGKYCDNVCRDRWSKRRKWMWSGEPTIRKYELRRKETNDPETPNGTDVGQSSYMHRLRAMIAVEIALEKWAEQYEKWSKGNGRYPSSSGVIKAVLETQS